MKIRLGELRWLIREELGGDSYRGEHTAPGKDDAPLWDLTMNGVYPDDVYSAQGSRYYGIGDGSDSVSWGVVKSVRGKPRASVKIYRAVPWTKSREETLADLRGQMKYITKHGKVPPSVVTTKGSSEYYGELSSQVAELEGQSEEFDSAEKLKINPGDWVAIDRQYAVDHGDAVLGGRGKYRVVSKTVPASTLYTDGNSIMEWGYNP
jgi:hypothetical protein